MDLNHQHHQQLPLSIQSVDRCYKKHGTDTQSKHVGHSCDLLGTGQVEQRYREKANVTLVEMYIFTNTVEETLNLPTSALTS
jgi:hypothetical protein